MKLKPDPLGPKLDERTRMVRHRFKWAEGLGELRNLSGHLKLMAYYTAPPPYRRPNGATDALAKQPVSVDPLPTVHRRSWGRA
jgi:hypothetical protein